MAAQWGKYLELSIFGESHGKGIGMVMGRLPAGLEIDTDFIEQEMKRRAPGKSVLTTPRKEADQPEIISGMLNGKTTGAPLTMFIANTDTRSKDYSNMQVLLRPAHSDYPAGVKYNNFNDIRGGGHFSGRLTAPLVFAGAIAKLALQKKGIVIGSRIASIATIHDSLPNQPTPDELSTWNKSSFPTANPAIRPQMEECILQAKNEGDSVGGTIEVWALGVPAGLGEPFFYSLESSLASLVFSVPAVKGLEFGAGFALTQMRGSEANNSYHMENNRISVKNNIQGGILGGITIGAPLSFRVAIKPTASISKPQQTVNVQTLENDVLKLVGRHDPCIVPRACVVLEAVAALSIWDMMLGVQYES
ncbi:MAG: chorismate synthase [Brevinema sp.]